MTSNENPSIVSKILQFFGKGQASDGDESLKHTGDRDGALTMSKEPTGEEIARVASEKNDPERKDS